tara:strand:- start:406 stop:582 length:177 start_codon:yes stop_codon:yes gene_type:complete
MTRLLILKSFIWPVIGGVLDDPAINHMIRAIKVTEPKNTGLRYFLRIFDILGAPYEKE